MIRGWECTACQKTKSQISKDGCGLPGRTNPVRFDSGVVEHVLVACPMTPVGLTKLYYKIKFWDGWA